MDRNRLKEGVARRLAWYFSSYFANKVQRPVFFVGFNNSGKSMILGDLACSDGFVKYPTEGNKELWFEGFFPWLEASPGVPPVWCDPQRFKEVVLSSRSDRFCSARAHLGAYQWINRGKIIVNDSGMLGALLPDVLQYFPDAKIIHFIRDGRVASYLSARAEWVNIMRVPQRYKIYGCEPKFEFLQQKMAKYWEWTVGNIESTAAQGYKYLEVRYENICDDPDSNISEIMEFIGLDKAGPISGKKNKFQDMNKLVLSEMSPDERMRSESLIESKLSQLGYL